MIRDEYLNRIMLNMPDDVLQRLKDIAIECIRLEAETRRPNISTCRRRIIQKRMKELIRERDKILYENTSYGRFF